MSKVYDMLESKLMENIQFRAPQKFQDAGLWKNQTLGTYMVQEDSAKLVVLETVNDVAKHFEIQLAGHELVNLQQQIKLTETTAHVLSKMFATMHGGKKCPPGTYPDLETVQLPNGDQVTEWVCRKL